jgi:SAM-dependent methyltransferase
LHAFAAYSAVNQHDNHASDSGTLTISDTWWSYHYRLLRDEPRNAEYRAAIEHRVGTNDVVADLGAGTGFLSVLAAAAGARHVYAIEREPALAALIRRVADDNDVGDKVTVLTRDAMHLTTDDFAAAPTLFVSELIGVFPPAENMHAIARRARTLGDRDACFLPSSYQLGIALVDESAPLLREMSSVCGVDLGAFAKAYPTHPKMIYVEPEALRSRPGWSRPISFFDDEPRSLTWELQPVDSVDVHAIVLFFATELSDALVLSTMPGTPKTSWPQIVLPLDKRYSVDRDTMVRVTVTFTGSLALASWIATIGASE